jgi:hypothetical protein
MFLLKMIKMNNYRVHKNRDRIFAEFENSPGPPVPIVFEQPTLKEKKYI